MSETESKETIEKIKMAMKISAEKFLAKKKLLNQKFVISENGKIKIIDPSEL